MGTRSRFPLVLLFVVIAAALFAGGVYTGWRTYGPMMRRKYEQRVKARQDRLVGKPAPDVESTTASGEPWRLRDHRGKVVVLGFWATWSAPGFLVTATLKEIHAKHKDRQDFLLVGVSLDHSTEELVEYCRREGIQWLQLIEPGVARTNSVATAFEVVGIPDVCIVNKDGTVDAVGCPVGDIAERVGALLNPKQ